MKRWLLLLVAVMVVFVSTGGSNAVAASFVPLTGDGSSWAEPAIDQWTKDVASKGIVINFSGDGSAAGRSHYIDNQADFAASDIAFLTQGDPFGGGIETPNVAYSYVPIVAGGTTFMYNLKIGNRKVTDLRLSGLTLSKIFTGAITNWDDPAIEHDYGAALPSQKITVVTRSDGSGATYEFTRWMSKEYPQVWDPFCTAHGGKGCGPTEFYPPFNGAIQRNGSDQVADYIASSSIGEGSIGYDEYAYALNNGIPVVKLLNAAGYYTLPTASNVAVALEAAQIDENPASLTYLIENLDNVYTDKDPRAYPLSSYSYLIVPRTSRVINGNTVGPPSRFNTSKGATLSTWMNYVLCGAQQKAGSLGYSPLPENLVLGGFKQVGDIPGAVPAPVNLADPSSLNSCNNPTYLNGVNVLTKDAPYPSACDKLGAPLTCSTAGTEPSGGVSLTITTKTTVTRGKTTRTRLPTTGKATSGTAVDPDTGQTAAVAGPAGANSGTPVYAQPVAVADKRGQDTAFAILTALEILAAISIPALLGRRLRRKQ